MSMKEIDLRIMCTAFSQNERHLLTSGLRLKRNELERQIELLRKVRERDGDQFKHNEFLTELEASLVEVENLYAGFY